MHGIDFFYCMCHTLNSITFNRKLNRAALKVSSNHDHFFTFLQDCTLKTKEQSRHLRSVLAIPSRNLISNLETSARTNACHPDWLQKTRREHHAFETRFHKERSKTLLLHIIPSIIRFESFTLIEVENKRRTKNTTKNI